MKVTEENLSRVQHLAQCTARVVRELLLEEAEKAKSALPGLRDRFERSDEYSTERHDVRDLIAKTAARAEMLSATAQELTRLSIRSHGAPE